eukprot:764499-Hanusia_phi.AAC.9
MKGQTQEQSDAPNRGNALQNFSPRLSWELVLAFGGLHSFQGGPTRAKTLLAHDTTEGNDQKFENDWESFMPAVRQEKSRRYGKRTVRKSSSSSLDESESWSSNVDHEDEIDCGGSTWLRTSKSCCTTYTSMATLSRHRG